VVHSFSPVLVIKKYFYILIKIKTSGTSRFRLCLIGGSQIVGGDQLQLTKILKLDRYPSCFYIKSNDVGIRLIMSVRLCADLIRKDGLPICAFIVKSHN